MGPTRIKKIGGAKRNPLLCRIFKHSWETDHIHSTLTAVVSVLTDIPVQCARCGKTAIATWTRGKGIHSLQEEPETGTEPKKKD